MDLFRIKEISEEFPSSWSLIVINIKFLGNHVKSTRGWHGSSSSSDTSSEIRDVLVIGNNNSNTVRWSHEETLSKNHVSVCIAIAGSSKLWSSCIAIEDSHFGNQVFGICQVRVWMSTSKIAKDIAPHEILDLEDLSEDFLGVWTGDSVHSIETHGEVWSCKQRLDAVEVEKGAHQLDVLISIGNN